MILKTVVYLAFHISLLYNTVYCLTCLSCDRITQPRHCHFVARCNAGEVCGAERLSSTGDYQYQAYKLGCIAKTNCNNGTSVNGTSCDECCTGDLCNAHLCGEPDYPVARGPICYDCQFHTDRQPCRHIEFCSSDEDCSLAGVEEFGEVALSSGCRPKYSCPAPELPPGPFIGKRSVVAERSAGSAVCEWCCSKDLCNLNCSSANHCSYSNCKHGHCVTINSTSSCQCLPGWKGPKCDIVDHCSPSPCQQGLCSETASSYSCSCFLGWSGSVCDRSELDCDFEVGLCTWTQSNTDDMDWTRNSGSTPSSSTGPYGDHTTGSGYYMYIETSSGATGYKADLVSRHLPPHETYCMELALNMYGSQVGSVNIYLEPDRKTKFEIQHFKKEIPNTSQWMVKNVTIPAQPRKFSIIIESVRGTGYQGDVAIDDIKLFGGPCN